MTGTDAQSAYAALYGVRSDDLRRSLPDMADGLSAQLHELYARPSTEGAEQLSVNLDGARRALLRYREALIREGID